MLEGGKDGGVSLGTGDQLKQREVARRVEEVGAEAVLPERRAAAFDNLGDGDARGVCGDNGLGLTDGLKARHQRLLGAKLLDNHLNDPVAVGQLGEIILGVAERDQAGAPLVVEVGRARLPHPVEAALDNAVPHGGVRQGQPPRLLLRSQLGGRHIEQQHWQADTGNQGGNRGAHRASADHGDTLDLLGHLILLDQLHGWRITRCVMGYGYDTTTLHKTPRFHSGKRGVNVTASTRCRDGAGEAGRRYRYAAGRHGRRHGAGHHGRHRHAAHRPPPADHPPTRPRGSPAD